MKSEIHSHLLVITLDPRISRAPRGAHREATDEALEQLAAGPATKTDPKMEDLRQLQLPGDVRMREKTLLLMEEHLISLVSVRMPGGSLLLWVGQPLQLEKAVGALALCMRGAGTQLLGDDPTAIGQQLGERISGRFNQQRPVYVSFNLTDGAFAGQNVLLQLEREINEFLETNDGDQP